MGISQQEWLAPTADPAAASCILPALLGSAVLVLPQQRVVYELLVWCCQGLNDLLVWCCQGLNVSFADSRRGGLPL
jgi:hypothetical protein